MSKQSIESEIKAAQERIERANEQERNTKRGSYDWHSAGRTRQEMESYIEELRQRLRSL